MPTVGSWPSKASTNYPTLLKTAVFYDQIMQTHQYRNAMCQVHAWPVCLCVSAVCLTIVSKQYSLCQLSMFTLRKEHQILFGQAQHIVMYLGEQWL